MAAAPANFWFGQLVGGIGGGILTVVGLFFDASLPVAFVAALGGVCADLNCDCDGGFG